MTKHVLTLMLFLLSVPVFSQSLSDKNAGEAGQSQKERAFVFFSEAVPRYRGLAAGVFLNNQYALGGWSDFALANLGGGLDAEYTLPAFLPCNMDLGASLHAEGGVTFPKKGTTLKSHRDIRLYTGAFLRIPFTFLGQAFAFQPEIGYGMDFSRTVGQKGSRADGWYSDQTIVFAPALRYMAPVKALSPVEFELSPYWTLSPERKGETMDFLGFRIGSVWHFRERKAGRAEELSAVEAGPSEEEEENRKAEERLRKELRRELDRVLRNPELFLGVNPEDLTDFTPDGDGNHDTIAFHPATRYMSEPPVEWTLKIIDPKGNDFKTWSGKGFPPQEIVWDGTGDDGSVAFSRETYKAHLAVTLCDRDRELLGRGELEAVVEGNVSIANGVILKATAKDEWRIELTSISFDPDAATFNNLTKVQRREFLQSLDEIAERVLSVEGTKIRVEGYANNTSGTEEENVNDLIPLSQKRAEKIAEMLIERGINKETITAVGMGGANPKATLSDRENWWKNRRIEIVLTKEAATIENSGEAADEN
ncbi:OmpA family protein [Treponema sp.]|uniref:OmpA family protein n=1 Tax=Treponema sp. TaxID=166 RepID=UPI00257B0E84|nr:OmpA family protein [Treponema sp.]MBE6353598.1 OmpA family protein [Treponema sp.]